MDTEGARPTTRCHCGRHFYRPGQVLAAGNHAELVDAWAAAHAVAARPGKDLDELVCFEIDGADAGQVVDGVRRSCRERYDGWAPVVGHNHVLGLHPVETAMFEGAPRYVGGPGGAPEPAPGPAASRGADRGQGVTVGLADTAIYPHDWLSGAYLAAPADVDEEQLRDRRAAYAGWLDPDVGHATFIAGLVLAEAGAATVRVAACLGPDGLADELDLIAAIGRLREAGVGVLNLSLGTATCDGRPPPLLARALDRLEPWVVVVAAAGNYGRTEPFWPAALPGVIGVGALAADGRAPAQFSNRGPWVDAWVTGDELVSTYVPFLTERGPFPADPRESWASWGGTSFAAARVAGLVAAAAGPERPPWLAARELLAAAPAERSSGFGRVLEAGA